MKVTLEQGWRKLLFPTFDAELSFAVVELDQEDMEFIKETIADMNEVQAMLRELIAEQGGDEEDVELYSIPIEGE